MVLGPDEPIARIAAESVLEYFVPRITELGFGKVLRFLQQREEQVLNMQTSLAKVSSELRDMWTIDPFDMLHGMCCGADAAVVGPFILRQSWACFSLRGMLPLVREARATRLDDERVASALRPPSPSRPIQDALDYSRFDSIVDGADTDDDALSSLLSGEDPVTLGGLYDAVMQGYGDELSSDDDVPPADDG